MPGSRVKELALALYAALVPLRSALVTIRSACDAVAAMHCGELQLEYAGLRAQASSAFVLQVRITSASYTTNSALQSKALIAPPVNRAMTPG